MSTKTTLGSGTTDTFIPTDSVGTEDSLNIYNFSDAHNWSNGIPVSDEAAVIAPGSAVIAIDDIASLDLTQLTLGAGVDVLTEDDNLTLGSLVLDAGGGQQVSAESDGTAPSTLTLSALSGTDGVFGADGTGASFIDDAADTGFNTFYVADGGLTELKNAPASSSTLDFDGNGGTLALFNPGSTVASSLQVLIDGSANKDVLELPGSAVIGSIHYGSNFLDVVTTAGTYDFTNVSYANGTPTGFSASFDHATGLEAITFTGAVTPPPPSTDTFVPTDSVGTEDSLNIYNFSDAQNWSNGIPVSGEAAVIAPGSAVIAIDDIASLDLTQLTLGAGVAVLTADTDLTLGSLVLDAGGGQQVSAESDGSSPSTVTLSALSGSGGAFGADGTGASFIDSAADTGSNTFFVADHGLTELKNAPASSSTLDFDSNGGTLALFNPGSSSTISSLLEGSMAAATMSWNCPAAPSSARSIMARTSSTSSPPPAPTTSPTSPTRTAHPPGSPPPSIMPRAWKPSPLPATHAARALRPTSANDRSRIYRSVIASSRRTREPNVSDGSDGAAIPERCFKATLNCCPS